MSAQHLLDQRPYRECNRLNLSGTVIRIAVLDEKEGICLAMHTDESAEPIFFTANEARLLIAALFVGVDEIEGRT